MEWARALAALGELRTYEADQMIFQPGQPGQAVYVILEGSVLLLAGDHCTVAAMGAGQLLGGEVLLTAEPYRLTARADTDARLLCLPAAALRPVAERSPELLLRLADSLSRTQQALAQRLSAVTAGLPVSPPEPTTAPVIKTAAKAAPMPVQAAKSAPASPPASAVKPAAAKAEPKTEPPKPLSALLPDNHPVLPHIAPDSDAGFLVDKRFKCPCCYKDFEDTHVLNYKLKTLRVTPDFRTLYQDFNMLWYAIRLCPHCNAAALSQAFEQLSARDFKLSNLNGYREAVPRFSGFSRPRAIMQVLESYYLALAYQDYRNGTAQARAQLWRRLKWLYGDLEQPELARSALERCLHFYKESFQNEHLTGAESVQIGVTIADLLLESGERTAAMRYYYEAIHGEDKSQQAYLRHAADCLADLRNT